MFYILDLDDPCKFKLYLNEVAPRVHNSGHHTIDTHTISQFEMLARILLKFPITQPIYKPYVGGFVMRNMYISTESTLLEVHTPERSIITPYKVVNHMCVTDPNRGPFIYDYQKGYAKPWRKIGHITFVNETQQDANSMVDWCKIGNVIEFVPVTLQSTCGKRVGIIMGSDSDWHIMSDACKCLRILNVDFEVTVVSAHRTPDRLVAYAKTAEIRGIGVIIAGAGGAAHLPGMVAAFQSTIPVIGVPIKTLTLNGLDSLYSIVQMPPCVPVACMAINGAQNAAIFAAQILAIGFDLNCLFFFFF